MRFRRYRHEPASRRIDHARNRRICVTDTVSPVQEPVAKQIEHHWDRPTGRVEDPWAWLRDRDDPDTIAYLEAENAYCDEWFSAHADVVEAIFGEIKSRIQETDLTAPV